MATVKEVKERRKKIISLVLKGMHREDIAKKYDITPRTVDTDIANVKKEIAKRLDKMTRYERLSEYEETARMRTGRLWHIALDEKSSRSQIMRAVELLQREDVLKIRRDQMIGLFPKEDINMNFNQINLNQINRIEIVIKEPDYDQIPGIVDVEKDDDDEKETAEINTDTS